MQNLLEKIRDFFGRLLGSKDSEENVISNLPTDEVIENAQSVMSQVVQKTSVTSTKSKTRQAHTRPEIPKKRTKSETTKPKTKSGIVKTNPKSTQPKVNRELQRRNPKKAFTVTHHPSRKDLWAVVDANGKPVYVTSDRLMAEASAREYNATRAEYDVKLDALYQKTKIPFDLTRHEENYGDWRSD